MTPGFRLLIATHNLGKVREVQQALQYLPVKLSHLEEFSNVSLVNEVGKTYEENAVLKAMSYARQTGVWALADDSGLEVDALGGGPGVYSARFCGRDVSDHNRIHQLLTAMSKNQSAGRTARFVCCMALAGWPITHDPLGGEEPHLLMVTEAYCYGAISLQPKGVNGFGFDPVFVPQGHAETFAQLPAEVKAKISHRSRALFDVRRFLDRLLPQT